MKIQYLIDIKKALADVPDEVLEIIGWGTGEDSEGVEMCVWDDDYISKWGEYNEKYPQLSEINKLVEKIKKADSIMQSDKMRDEFIWMEEPISSTDEIK